MDVHVQIDRFPAAACIGQWGEGLFLSLPRPQRKWMWPNTSYELSSLALRQSNYPCPKKHKVSTIRTNQICIPPYIWDLYLPWLPIHLGDEGNKRKLESSKKSRKSRKKAKKITVAEVPRAYDDGGAYLSMKIHLLVPVMYLVCPPPPYECLYTCLSISVYRNLCILHSTQPTLYRQRWGFVIKRYTSHHLFT